MVSNANEDFPEPLMPVITTSLLRDSEVNILWDYVLFAPKHFDMLIACVVCEVGHRQNIIECKGKGIIHQTINWITLIALVKVTKIYEGFRRSF